MARTKDRERAVVLRKKGMSYSQIKNELNISKGTLSGWLNDMPLSPERMKTLRNTEAQIEKTRQTKLKKKLARRQSVYDKVSRDIKKSKDVDFVVGFYLYWGEGTKTSEYSVSLADSDPSMIRCFVCWMLKLGIDKKFLRGRLHVYSDQDEPTLRKFWSKQTGIPLKNFTKSYVKTTNSSRKTYKGMFSYGTCVVAHHNRDIYEYVLEGVRFLRDSNAIEGKSKIG